MRVLQLIDSLRPGGAEKMSVTYANALAKRIEGSFLCCTRNEGLLKSQLSPDVGYQFLNKKSTLDPKAFFKLRKFIKNNKIDLIQAHSSSWFLALLVKLSLKGVKIVWHDHYGRSLKQRFPGALQSASRFFDGIISVNRDLETWSRRNLKCETIRYIPNFFLDSNEINFGENSSPLFGQAKDFKIISLANLRPQKDHLNLLKAFNILFEKEKSISLHLIGKDFNDEYSQSLQDFIFRNDLKSNVYLYGEQEDVKRFLKHADLGILSSISEGLPIALLEYGLAGLPVVCTGVGECSAVIGKYGKIVSPQDPLEMAEAVKFYFENEEVRKKNAKAFKSAIRSRYSESSILPVVLQYFSEINEVQNG